MQGDTIQKCSNKEGQFHDPTIDAIVRAKRIAIRQIIFRQSSTRLKKKLTKERGVANNK
jgi:hypothetical protein